MALDIEVVLRMPLPDRGAPRVHDSRHRRRAARIREASVVDASGRTLLCASLLSRLLPQPRQEPSDISEPRPQRQRALE